jgi:hypothetical protein
MEKSVVSIWGCSCFHCSIRAVFLGRRPASWCEMPATFRELTSFPSSRCCWGLGKTKLITGSPTVSCGSLRSAWAWEGMRSPCGNIFIEFCRRKTSRLTSSKLLSLLNINPLRPELVYTPTGLTLNNSMFCPHTVFMCFVWISEQTAIILLYSINWLVFITETEQCLLRGKDYMLYMCLGTNSDYFPTQH